jgi:hypothetical protein
MSTERTAIIMEVIRGIFELLRTWWVVAGLVVIAGMYSGVLTQGNIITVLNKIVAIFKQ